MDAGGPAPTSGEAVPVPEAVTKLITQGQRIAMEGHNDKAADKYSEALQIMAATYGELGEPCANVYQLYGMALLAQARTESALGGDGGGPEDGEEDDGEPSTLELAWEILETARIILERMSGEEAELQQAEVRSELGSIHLEQNNWPDAIGEFTEVVKLQLTNMPGSRTLAESYLLLAVSYHHADEFQKAIPFFHESAKILKDNIAIQEAKPDAATKAKIQKDIDGMKICLKEVEEKIKDAEMEAVKKEKADAAKAKAGGGGGAAEAGPVPTTAAVTNGGGGGGGGSSAEGTTTIGFGKAPSSEGVTTIGFGKAPSAEGTTTIGFGKAPSSEGVTTIGFGNPAPEEGTTIGFGARSKRSVDAVPIDITARIRKKPKSAA